MENGIVVRNGKISAEDVISKLKDDGDFDRLRLKIIRKLKDNEELRKSIISAVKQSAVFDRPGARNMKPRQLSDAIHEEVGEKVMSQISDYVWDIIRSGDGMKTEITETVQSVYSKLLNPKGNEDGESSSCIDLIPGKNRLDTDGPVAATANKVDSSSLDNEPDEPPGFALSELCENGKNNHVAQRKEEMRVPASQDGEARENLRGESQCSPNVLEPGNIKLSATPGFFAVIEHKQPCDDSEEDLDAPPGFS